MIGILVVLLLVPAASIVGCAAPPDATGGGRPDFEGFITAIEPGPDGSAPGTITVESHADKRVRRIVVTVNKDTSIVRQDGAETRRAGFDAFHLRDRVQLWFAGPVRKSFPEEAAAKEVVVRKGY